jgi:hypothetical protein
MAAHRVRDGLGRSACAAGAPNGVCCLSRFASVNTHVNVLRARRDNQFLSLYVQTKGMQIRVLLPGASGASIWQERTIISDKKQFRMPWSVDQAWSVRSVRVDRTFDLLNNSSFENAEYVIICPPSRRLSQHFLRAMQNERRDQMLGRWMPLFLLAFIFAAIGCFVWGWGSSRCVCSPIIAVWNRVAKAVDCTWQEKRCVLSDWEGAAAEHLSESTMKILLLLSRFLYLLLYASIYLLVLSFSTVSFYSWFMAQVQNRTYAPEETGASRRNRQSLDGPVSRSRYPSVRT